MMPSGPPADRGGSEPPSGPTRTGVVHQPSLFGVAASDPVPADLAGLLAGPGALQRMGGTARVSVTVDAGWRVHALMAELALRDLPASWEPAQDAFVVRTPYTTRLLDLARSWHSGPPRGLHLGGQALRLWVVAAGAPVVDEEGYLLGLGTADGRTWSTVEATWSAGGAALAAAGLAAALVVLGGGTLPAGKPPAAGRAAAYRVTGRRRLARLAELVGDPPASVAVHHWPSVTRRS